MKRFYSILSGLLLFTLSVFSQSWSLTGNAGSTNSNFIGTTDSRPLIFKVNNQWTAGYTGYGGNYNVSFGFRSFNPLNSGWDNTALGAQTLTNNTSGIRNVAIGTYALDPNTTGQDNVAIGETASGKQNGAVSFTVAIGRAALMSNQKNGNTGVGFEAAAYNTGGEALTALGYKALNNNSSGSNNSGLGFNSLINNTTGFNNTAVGAWTMVGNTTGDNNTAVGTKSLYANTIGEYNTAIGTQALELNTTGYWNIGLGSGALNQNKTGYLNTAIGTSALWNNTTGHNNTATGEEALGGNIDGSMNTAVGSRALWSHSNTTGTSYGNGNFNTALGYEAIRELTTGTYNIGVGVHSLLSNNTGSGNVAVGCYSLAYNTTGSSNIAIGCWALGTNGTGKNNTAIGNYADVSSNNLTNATAVGSGALATKSNQVVIGNSDVISIRGYVSWSTVSDSKVMKNMKANIPGLTFINQLKPVTYNLNLGAGSAQENQLYSGFVAQDVEKAAQDNGYNFSGIDTDSNTNGLKALRYSDFTGPMVQAIQELSAKNNEKDATIASLKQQVEDLSKVVKLLADKVGIDNVSMSPPNTNATTASLDQNYPNPFNQSTTISYSLPQNYLSAKIIVTDSSGKVFKQIPLTGYGTGNIKIETGALSSGVYFYSLYVDNTLVDTKKMVLSK